MRIKPGQAQIITFRAVALAVTMALLFALTIVAHAHVLDDANGNPIPHRHHIIVPGPNNDFYEIWVDGQPAGKLKAEEFTADQKAAYDAKQKAAHPGIEKLNDATRSYNCHGLTFGGSGSIIFSPRVQKILDAGYKEVKGPAKVGDIVVYRVSGEVTHSGLVTKVDGNGNVTEVRSKWGDNAEYLHAPLNVPDSYGTTPEVWRDKAMENGAAGDPAPGFIGAVIGGPGDGSEVCSVPEPVGGAVDLLVFRRDSDVQRLGDPETLVPIGSVVVGITAVVGVWHIRRRRESHEV